MRQVPLARTPLERGCCLGSVQESPRIVQCNAFSRPRLTLASCDINWLQVAVHVSIIDAVCTGMRQWPVPWPLLCYVTYPLHIQLRNKLSAILFNLSSHGCSSSSWSLDLCSVCLHSPRPCGQSASRHPCMQPPDSKLTKVLMFNDVIRKLNLRKNVHAGRVHCSLNMGCPMLCIAACALQPQHGHGIKQQAD